MSKHIDVVVKYFYPVAAGIETNVIETYSVLAEKGWDITIHTSKDTYLEKNSLPDEEVIRGLKIKRYPFGLFGYWPDINWFQTDFVCLHNFDIFPHFRLLVYSLLLKLARRKKFALILTPHGGFNPEWSLFSFSVRLIKKCYHDTFGAMFIKSVADGIIAVSEWEKEQITDKGVCPASIVVIGNGLEGSAYGDVEKESSSEIKKAVQSYAKYIIQVGRISSIKNYEITINALAKLPSDIKYLIVGPVHESKYKNKLEIIIKKMGLEDRVIFTGVIRGVDKYFLIKKAQLMVHMSFAESYCSVVHEGLRQGLVCIVSNEKALPYLVKDGINGYCLDVRDSEALSKKISYVLENKNSPSIVEMEERNRECGLRNSWREVAATMEQYYNKFLSGTYEIIGKD